MLRITNVQQEGMARVMRLEGKLLAPWIGELHDACRVNSAAMPSITLDLAGLSFVDASGTLALRELRRRGVKFTGCSPLVAELLKENHS